MNWRRGLARLWLVLSVSWAVFVIGWHLRDILSARNFDIRYVGAPKPFLDYVDTGAATFTALAALVPSLILALMLAIFGWVIHGFKNSN
jgi:hypothetical protein